MVEGWIEVHLRGSREAPVGCVPPFSREFYDRVSRDTPEASLWGLRVELRWRGGYGKLAGIAVDLDDLPKLLAVGLKPFI
jgi:hypothetical protein